MVKVATWCEEKTLEKTLMLGKMKWLDSIVDSMDMSLSKLQEIMKDRKAQHAAVHTVAKSRTQLSHRTTIL